MKKWGGFKWVGQSLFETWIFIAYQYIKNQGDAEDIVQEAFVKIWKNLKKFDQSKKFKVWFYEIIKNTAIDYVRKYRDISFTEWEQTTGREIDHMLSDNEELSTQIDQELAYGSYTKVSHLFKLRSLCGQTVIISFNLTSLFTMGRTHFNRSSSMFLGIFTLIN